MTYKVAIRKNATGEVRVIDQDYEFDHGAVWMWQDGNYSCDCNRHLFFERAGGRDPNSDDYECGETLYTVPYIETPDGTHWLIDAHRAAA